MGCDIHLFVEVKKKKSLIDKLKFWKPTKWVSVDKWYKYEDGGHYIQYDDRFYTGRNYNLFTALCGVRSHSFSNKPPMISEPKGLPNDCSFDVKRISDEWEGDAHSHSYNTLSELMKFDWSDYGETCDYFRLNTIPKLQALSNNPDNVRIVYFFDN